MTTLQSLTPVIVLLLLGVVGTIACRAVRLSPIVGYILIGLVINLSGYQLMFSEGAIMTLADLGVIFLLFDIGLHFSTARIIRQAKDIFGFGPLQVLLATGLLSLGARFAGLSWPAAMLIGGAMSLSSTAVVGRIVSERRQQGCPVALTATSILIFQDIAAILLLIIASAHGESVWRAAGTALAKGAIAVVVAVALARTVIGPVLKTVARAHNEEVFTAAALLIALAAGWATGMSGLSLTLGAFLGGLMLAETPYRTVIVTEIRPFKGLLMGFFFISIGLSLDANVLRHDWGVILALTGLLFVLKIAANIAASLVFRWSVPGSMQLGFLIAQASEFGFVILALPEIRSLVGNSAASIAIAVTALSIALTPSVADLGRILAGRLRARIERSPLLDAELRPEAVSAPVIIIGMNAVGRLVADAMIAFKVDYISVEHDVQILRTAIADGYNVVFGDGGDHRLWATVNLAEREVSVLTAPTLEGLASTSPIAKRDYPALKRYALAADDREATAFRQMGLKPVVAAGPLPGLALAETVLATLGMQGPEIREWATAQLKMGEPALMPREAAA